MSIYYVKNSGNNSNTGLSDAQAWATIAKVNGFTFAAGDTISFNKGDVWREYLFVPRSGTSGAYMVFNSYGTGVNPQILCSNISTSWTNYSGNIWVSSSTFTNPRASFSCDIHFINLNASHTWGAYKATTGACVAEYDWTWSGNYIYVYAATDPDIRYSGIEIPQRQAGIEGNNKDYIHINGIDIFYGIYEGITYDWDISQVNRIGLIIENLKVAYIGGNISSTGNENGFGIDLIHTNTIVRNCEIHDCGRRSLGWHVYGSCTITNVLVEDCYFHEAYHTTGVDISVNSSGAWMSTFDGVIIRRNTFYDPVTSDYYANQIFLQDYTRNTPPSLINIYIYNNIFITPNSAAINMEGTYSVYVYNNTFYSHNTVQTGNIAQLWIDTSNNLVKVKNNIFYTSRTNDSNFNTLELYSSSSQDETKIDSNYNLYWATSATVRIIDGNGSAYNRTQIANVRSALGWEINSPTPTDPTFVSTTNYHLQAGSPAIGTGVYLNGVVDTDFDGNARSNPPSIGAYEYGSNPPTTSSLTIGSTPITDIKIGSTLITKVIRNDITYWQV